jgi:hypothetical protein
LQNIQYMLSADGLDIEFAYRGHCIQSQGAAPLLGVFDIAPFVLFGINV